MLKLSQKEQKELVMGALESAKRLGYPLKKKNASTIKSKYNKK